MWTSDDDVGGQEIDFVRTSFFFYPGKLGSDSHTQLVCTYHRNPLACYLSLSLFKSLLFLLVSFSPGLSRPHLLNAGFIGVNQYTWLLTRISFEKKKVNMKDCMLFSGYQSPNPFCYMFCLVVSLKAFGFVALDKWET